MGCAFFNFEGATYREDHIPGQGDLVDSPQFSPVTGTYDSDQNISISSTTAGATIYYTTDGSTPSTASNVYQAPIQVAGDGTNITIKAFAIKEGLAESAVETAIYTINYNQVSTPQFSVAAGTYSSDQSVVITTTTAGATIYYTTDGSDPTMASSIYSLPILVSGNGTSMTIKAMAVKSGMINSTVSSAIYSITYPAVATPAFSPIAGTYDADQNVIISTSTSGATIYYTLDGSAPTIASSIYSVAIPVAGDGTIMTIRSFAVKDGMSNSMEASGSFTINYSQASTPQFSVSSGTYGSNQSVAISTTTTSATIYYTTDGSNPTLTSSVYSVPISVSGDGTSMTIKAFAVKSGMTDSIIATGIYNILYAPSSLSFTGSLYKFILNTAISSLTPTFSGTVTSCSSTPALPTGLSIGTSTCIISGTPVSITANDSYTITASNATGSTQTVIDIAVNGPPGTLDVTFNGQGFVTHHNAAGGNGIENGNGIALQLDGKILVAGSSVNSSGNDDMCVWRFNSNGDLDTTFNDPDGAGGAPGFGYVCHNSAAGGNSSDIADDIVLQPDGKIVVTGVSIAGQGNYDSAVWRYNADGTLDLTFNGTGFVTYDIAGGSAGDLPRSISLQSDGKIVITGNSWNGSNNDMFIMRLNTDGILDTSFNGLGYVVHNNAAGGNGDDIGFSIKINPDGKILVTGLSWSSNASNDMVVWQYNSDGSLDSTFNGTGYFVHDNAAGGNGHDCGISLALQIDGKVLVTGYSWSSIATNYMIIWRLNANGSLDTTFNSSGYAVHGNAAGGNSTDSGHSVLIQSDGKIVIAGESRNLAGNDDMVIWRYHPNGTLDTTFNGIGYAVHNSAAGGGSSDFGVASAMQSDGRIVVGGYSMNSSGNYDMTIWRYWP